MKVTIYMLLLVAAIVWECLDDINGDTIKSNKKDVLMRSGFFLGAILYSWIWMGNALLPSALMPFAVFFAFFDYLVAYILIRRGVVEVPGAHWFSYLSGKKMFDQWLALIPPAGRIALRVVILAVTITLYIHG